MAAHRAVMPLITRVLYRVPVWPLRTLCAGRHRGYPERDGDMRRDSRDLLKQFPRPKELLYNTLTRALEGGVTEDKLAYINVGTGQENRVVLRIKWPRPFEVEGFGGRRIDAERHAAAQACKIFQDLGLLNSRRLNRHKTEAPPTAPEEDGGQGQSTARRFPPDTAEELAAMAALKEFPTPKHLLTSVIQVATGSSGSKDFVQYRHEGGRIKTCHLTITWPQTFTFVGRGARRTEAERKAAALGCQQLKALGLLDPDNKPLTHAMYHLSAVQSLREKQRRARRFDVPEHLLARMESYFQEFPLDSPSDLPEDPASPMEPADDWSDCAAVSDPITGRPYVPLSEERADELSGSLEEKWRLSAERPLQELPADGHKAAILSAIRHNPVVVIAGDTGCGKTTRIPRFILEDAILGGRGAHCNVIVTQPRRISAISVSQRVAQELGPDLRHNAGYQVRLESALPPRGGALLFCTVGVLLKKLQSNGAMEGLSHVIVDEVHERDVNTDFLLIVLKRMQEVNPGVKVILMSATGDNQRISEYFGGCPIVRVPGFMYPVQQRYLDDVLAMMGAASYQPPETNGECFLDLDLISKVVLHIDQHREPGSILCFLPGWQEIRGVQERLQEALQHRKGGHLILPVHSNVPLTAQQSIFQRPPPGVRKIVLATNIAETSVTIDDIVHVVDCGMQKEQRYDLRTKVSCLETGWVSKSNVTQRRGRAGRCQPGFSYHLFTRRQHREMADFEVPEILRIPLENLVLQAKIHYPEMTAEEFLSRSLECPNRSAIRDAVRLLQEIRVLDDREELTLLGQRVANISTDPSLAKAIVLATIFRCLQPLLVIVACLTRDPFHGTILNRAKVNKVKAEFSGEWCSDHLALVRILKAWREVLSLRDDLQRTEFLEENVLSRSALRYIQGLISQFSSNVHDACLVSKPVDCVKDESLCNQLSGQYELVKGVLLAGLYPNLIQVRRGQVIRGKFRPNSLLYRTKGGPVLLHKSTVNRDEQHFRFPWLTYFQAVKSTGVVFVRDSSMVHPLAVLLMTDSSVTCKDNDQQMAVFLSDSNLLKLESDSRTIRLLSAVRRALRSMVQRSLQDGLCVVSGDDERQYSELLSILVDLLNDTADCFRDPSQAEG